MTHSRENTADVQAHFGQPNLVLITTEKSVSALQILFTWP
jgi:hypothetical protein